MTEERQANYLSRLRKETSRYFPEIILAVVLAKGKICHYREGHVEQFAENWLQSNASEKLLGRG